jgi:hypothetical protein
MGLKTRGNVVSTIYPLVPQLCSKGTHFRGSCVIANRVNKTPAKLTSRDSDTLVRFSIANRCRILNITNPRIM